MKKMSLLLSLMALPLLFFAQKNDKHLWGKTTIDSLQKEPYSSWFTKNYNEYNPDDQTISQLKSISTKDISIKIFMGTWCGDTKRELPKLIKVLNEIHFPKSNIEIYAVSSEEGYYKQSKNREEKEYQIFRVPTFIILKKEIEINRIVELPVYSIEADLLAILSGQVYTPQYKSYGYIINWLQEGRLSDDNVLPSSLASQIKNIVVSSSELNACGYVLLSDGKIKEAVKVFRINANLYPETGNVWHSLAESYHLAGEKEKALTCIEQGLQYTQTDHSLIKEFLGLHQKIIVENGGH